MTTSTLALSEPTTANYRLREGIRPPKFAGKFAHLDYQASPMPVIAMYPIPDPMELERLELTISGLECKPQPFPWATWADLPRYRIRQPLICQIFNWAEVVEWEGIRLSDVLGRSDVETHEEGYVSVHSRDGVYFESLSMAEVADPRVLLATGLNGEPLPLQYGGPLRLVVPFLQGYKSVKWVGAINAVRHDPIGIKRLLAQSKLARLAPPWRDRYGIVPPEGRTSDPDLELPEEPTRADDIAPLHATGQL